MKRCPGCGETDVERFGKNKARPDGLQIRCKACRNVIAKNWYAGNSQEQVARTKASRNLLKKDIYNYLLSHPCECGESRPECLDFDHIDEGNKSANVSALVRKGARKQVFEEIEKCIVRCANCHRARTAQQFGWYAFLK